MIRSINNFVDASKAPDFLKAGLQAFPWIKEAVSLFNFFVGGGKSGDGAQPVRIQPLAINMSSKFKGTLTNTHTFQPIIFKTPGSKIAANSTVEYPHYNKTLGLFNLLKQPNFAYFDNIYVDNGSLTQMWGMFKLNQQLTMVQNPEAGVDIVEILAAFTYERTHRSNPSSYPTSAVITNSDLGYYNYTVYDNFQILDGKTSDGKEVWRTEYYKWCDIMNKHTWYFDGWSGGGAHYYYGRYGNFSIKFLIRFRRKNCPPGLNCQDILLVKKYKLNMVRGSIIVSFDPLDHCYEGIPYLTDYSDEQDFCNSAAYKNGRIQQPRIATSTFEEQTELDSTKQEKIKFNEGVFPNPAANFINLNLAGAAGKDYDCIITDVTGRRHSTFRYNSSQGIQKIDIGKLPEGVYIIKAYVLSKPAEYKIFKFVKTRQ